MTRNRSDEKFGQNKAPVKEFAGVTLNTNHYIMIYVQVDASSRDQKEKISGVEITKPKSGFLDGRSLPEKRFVTLALLRRCFPDENFKKFGAWCLKRP